eukprot:8950397-Alexandrium_andersonii.AAC.1
MGLPSLKLAAYGPLAGVMLTLNKETCSRTNQKTLWSTKLRAQNPARGGRDPSTSNWPNGPLRCSEPAK